MGGSKPVKAEAISGAVPELDGVAVRVVVDSYQFAVVPSRKLADVDIQHFGWGLGGSKPPGKTLISEFGLSMLAETRRGTETRTVLMDRMAEALAAYQGPITKCPPGSVQDL